MSQHRSTSNVSKAPWPVLLGLVLAIPQVAQAQTEPTGAPADSPEEAPGAVADPPTAEGEADERPLEGAGGVVDPAEEADEQSPEDVGGGGSPAEETGESPAQETGESPAQETGAVASPAEEADESPLEGVRLVVSPELFTRYELRRGYQALGVGNLRFRDFDAMAYRARMKFAIENLPLGPNASMEVVFHPQASGFWSGSGGLSDAPLSLHEGYLRPHFAETSWFQVGRFEMAYGDQWLIGPVGWHETGRSFDGARLHLAERRAGGAWLDVFFSAIAEGRTALPATTANDRIGAGDLYLMGAYANIGPWLSESLALDLYGLLHVAPATDELIDPGSGATASREGAAEATLGARAKQKVGIVDYRAEGGVQVGERVLGAGVVQSFAGAVDAEVGVRPHPRLRLAGQAFFATGDDPSTSKNEGWIDRYSTAHKWLGLSDAAGLRTNYLGGAFHVAAQVVDQFLLGSQTHVFARPYQAGTADFGYQATELDFFGAYTPFPGFLLRADYDVFLPGSTAFGAGAEAAHYLGVELRYSGRAVFGG